MANLIQASAALSNISARFSSSHWRSLQRSPCGTPERHHLMCSATEALSLMRLARQAFWKVGAITCNMRDIIRSALHCPFRGIRLLLTTESPSGQHDLEEVWKPFLLDESRLHSSIHIINEHPWKPSVQPIPKLTQFSEPEVQLNPAQWPFLSCCQIVVKDRSTEFQLSR
jgi:hypothetical protein